MPWHRPGRPIGCPGPRHADSAGDLTWTRKKGPVVPEGRWAIMAFMEAPSLAPSARALVHAHLSLRRLAVLALAGTVAGLWLFNTPAGLLGKADAIGYAVCHRIDLRSFHLGGRALPLCARCSGMYLGALLAIGYPMLAGRGRAGNYPDWRIMTPFGLFFLAFAVDGVNSYLSFFPQAPQLYPPSNLLRLVTGTLVGLGMGVVVYAAFNQSAWRDWRREAPLGSYRDLLLLLLLAAVLVLALLSGNPLVLYPLALLSGLAVLVVLAAVYTTVVLLVLRLENHATSWMGLFFPALLGFTLALLQIGALDLLRFKLTGTWAGFSL